MEGMKDWMPIKNLLFVCTGNTCRSPLAEALLREKAGEKVTVKSAGIHALPGAPLSQGSSAVLKQRGIKHHHFSQLVTPSLVEWADIILTMTAGHREWLVQAFPEEENKINTIKAFANKREGLSDIADPIGGSVEVYERTAAELEECIEQILVKIKAE